MASAEPIQDGMSHQLTEEERAVFDHRFRFTDRESPVVQELYDLAMEYLQGTDCTLPPEAADADAPVTHLDPMDIVQAEVRLPPLPAVMLELQGILQQPSVSADNIAAVIAKDPGLTAWLLKLVNSPYYGFPAKISTISRAVALVGTRQIQTLAIGGALNSLAILLPKGLINMESFWRHSVAVGIASQELWQLSGRPDGEQLFVAGLLHDCGKLALAYVAPQTVSAFNKRYGKDSTPLYMEEKKLLGFDHARLGGMLLHRWNMPLPLVVAVLRHHQVEEPSRYPEAATVHLADCLVTALAVSEKRLPPVPPLSAEALDVLSLPPQSLPHVRDTLLTRLDALCNALK